MSKRCLLATIISFTALTLGCPLHEGCPDPPRCGDGFGDFVDPAITAIGGAIDDQIDSLFAANSKGSYASMFGISSKSLFVNDAWAAACARPSTAACVNETKTAEYASCIIDETPFIRNGTVNLVYSGTPNCGFTAVGDTVTRTMNVSRTIPDNGLVKTFNVNIADTSSAGGGTILTITGANSFSLEILGVHKAVNNNANVITLLDIDLRTTEPITITGGLARDVRIVNGGTLQFGRDHGVLTLSPASLAYSSECCYPISGSIRFADTSDTGFVTTGTITFPRCGTATIQRDTVVAGSDPYDVSLVSCE